VFLYWINQSISCAALKAVPTGVSTCLILISHESPIICYVYIINYLHVVFSESVTFLSAISFIAFVSCSEAHFIGETSISSAYLIL
jgi:hypothetical protein